MPVGGGAYYDEAKFHMPVVSNSGPRSFHAAEPDTNRDFNFFAPGVREGIAGVSAFQQTVHRNHLYDGVHGREFDWDNFSDMVTNPVARKRNQYWWEVLQNGNEESLYPGIFQNTGTWNSQPTGRTALRFMRPFSTRANVNIL